MSSKMIPPALSQRKKAGLAPRRRRISALLLLAMVGLSAPAQCQDGAEWDRARAALKTSAPGTIAPAVARWRQLVGTENQGFGTYAGFVLAWPGFPQEEQLRKAAEKSLARETVDAAQIVALFDRLPPITNPARARYALSLAALGRNVDAAAWARAAWRGGTMSDADEAAIDARWGKSFTQDDHDARLEALLWDGAPAQAQRMLARASASRIALAQARLAIQQGQTTESPPPELAPDPQGAPADTSATTPAPDATPAPALVVTPDMLRDPGYLVDRARSLLRHGQGAEAASLLASRPALARPALDPRRWSAVLLAAARAGGPTDARRIATSAGEGFAPGTDISLLAFGVRDDYTSLMWLGASGALWQLDDPEGAAQLFWRYANAARTPMTRSKGFYWAGRALAQAGKQAEAQRYFEAAAQYANQFYGLAALERLGRPIPPLHDKARAQPTEPQRREFLARPLAQAVREVAREADWQTTIRFFREISNQAKSEADFVLVAELAQQLGRRDLAVIAGQAAENAGYDNFHDLAYPLIPVPPGADWTFTHAITRQESQFSHNALSRTGARGLMQLMPATAAETARRLGLPVSSQALFDDPAYNLTLGSAYFSRLVGAFRGSYPVAIAAYNAGPGNVSRWLASRGDPRANPNIDWVEWVERIPISETRNYVAHVLENAVTYEAMNPDKASYKGPNPLSHWLKDPRPAPAVTPAIAPTAAPPAPTTTP